MGLSGFFAKYVIIYSIFLTLALFGMSWGVYVELRKDNQELGKVKTITAVFGSITTLLFIFFFASAIVLSVIKPMAGVIGTVTGPKGKLVTAAFTSDFTMSMVWLQTCAYFVGLVMSWYLLSLVSGQDINIKKARDISLGAAIVCCLALGFEFVILVDQFVHMSHKLTSSKIPEEKKNSVAAYEMTTLSSDKSTFNKSELEED